MAATPAQIAATPRSDINLELLAIRLSNAVTADQAIYGRVIGDVNAIRQTKPDVIDIRYLSGHDGRTLLFSVDVPTLEAMRSGHYSAWHCLNEAYKVRSIDTHVFSIMPADLPHHEVTLVLKGIYDLERLAQDYQKVLVKGSVGPFYMPPGDGPTICVTREGDTWHYVFDKGRGDCPGGCTATTAYYFTTTPETTPLFWDQWDSESGVAEPEWYRRYGKPNGKNAACPRVEQ